MESERSEILKVLIFAVLFMTVAFVSLGCASDTYTVCSSGCDYSSIQAAVDAASPGDTIIVRDGTYNENITVYNCLTIQSENGSDSTIVRAMDEHIFKVTADNVNITGFTIEGDSSHCGVLITDVNNCNISDNIVSGNYQGIYLSNANQTIISNNTAFSNTNYGILLTGGSYYNQISKNNASNNLNQHGIGLLASSNNNTIANNTAKNNGDNGIYLQESSNNRIIDNNVSNNVNYHGISLSSSNSNEIRDNSAHSNHYSGIGLWTSSNNTIANNMAKNNGDNGIYLQESSNNRIIDNNVSNVNYGGNGIYLYASSTNNLTNNTANSNWDYGIYLYASSNNNLTSNTASSNQRGIYLSSSDSNNLAGNTASNNWYGIYLSSSSSNNLIDNTASSNDFDGIYLYSSSDSNILMSNTVNSNDYFGIFLSTSNSNNLSGNTANSNTDYGIYLRFSSNNTLTNNTVKENSRDISIYVSSDNDCNNIIENNTGSGDRPIRYYNHSVNLSDEVLSELILCNADNSNINDITIKGSTTMKNNGLFVYRTGHSNFTNINSSNNEYGIVLSSSGNNTLTSNTMNSNEYYGIYLYSSSNNNSIYNNYFDNTNNAFDSENNIWNISRTLGENIIGGSYLGGNYWSDYTGKDLDGDRLGDTLLPYNSSGTITTGGDWLPLVKDPYTNVDVGVTSNITLANSSDLAAYLPPEYDGMDISDAVVLNVDVTDDTPGNPADDAYTDITINVGSMNIATCKVFKSGTGFLPEVADITTLPTVDGEPAFSRDLVNNTVTIRLYVGDPLLGVVPAPGFELELAAGYNMISIPLNDSSVITASDLAATIGTSCTEVVRWDGASQAYVSHIPGLPLNNFATAAGAGYFVNVNNPTSVTFEGPGWTSPSVVALLSGYNMIGVPVNDSSVSTASTLAAKIGTGCTEVVRWDGNTQSYISHIPGLPLNDFAITGGQGYFVNVNNPVDVTFEGVKWED